MAQRVTEGSVTHYLALQMSHDLSRKACGKAAERLGKVTLRPGRVGVGQVGDNSITRSCLDCSYLHDVAKKASGLERP
ncbi:hypothetical protein E5288_WYG022803 [Bos mutus]|uniref:Uncharacterized protein n=1 Tax=Bos mutus TaxID=72004 RepID=A0A6B0R1W8_9CETA|nr:hypothetical protein [Bos mutus]